MSLLPRVRERQPTKVECLELGLPLHFRWTLKELVWFNFGIVLGAKALVRDSQGDY